MPCPPIVRFASSVALLAALLPASPAAAGRRPSPAPRASAARPAPRVRPPELRALELFPARIALRGPRARQHLVVIGVYADGSRRDLSERARYAIQGPRVVTVSPQGLVAAKADGATRLKVSVGSVQATLPVTVAESHAPDRISFARDIVPVLTRAGCNSLACHGSPVGKAGFKLSMYGIDPAQDYEAIARKERTTPEKGLRIDPTAPERSLLLLKPTMQVPHQGGLRFRAGSPDYSLLLAWLRAGAPMDEPPAPPVSRLEVLPAERLFSAAGETQRLVVMAHHADGSAEDVTEQAVFQSQDEAVVAAETGQIRAEGVGEAVVLVRHRGKVGLVRVLVPQPVRVTEKEYAAFRPANVIDRLTLAKWKKLRFVPSEPCTDAEFLRRVRLDLTGTLPTPEEIRSFLADRSPDKRARKIDELLATPEYADWWTVFWGDNLRVNSRLTQPNGARAYRDWIRRNVAENTPYDRFVRELLTATGATFSVGPANFFRVARTPAEQAEQTAQLFLGIRIQCAQCHNHPFEKWTQTDYHRFAALFARVQTRGLSQGETLVADAPTGEYRHPETRQPLEPAVLADDPTPVPPERERRQALAAWLTAPDNPYFARNLVNRLWGQLFGRGIVEPVDDVRVTNPPVNPELLDTLAREFVASGFDVRQMLRLIANSRTYQLSVRANRFNEADRQNFSRAYYRRLKAEALLDAICQATGVPENFPGYPAGTRAIQLTDNRVASYFLDIFGRPRREIVCTCERDETANLTQALHMINGTVNIKIRAENGRLAELLRSGRPDSEIVEELYLRTVSRPPLPAELRQAAKQIESAGPDRRQAFEDIFWVLLNSREFMFNH